MLVVEVAKFLSTNGVGTYSETLATASIFVAKIPATPDTCVCIFPTGGGQADSKLGYDPLTFQIIVRGTKNPTVASDKACAIYNLLHGFRSGVFTANGTWIVSCLGIQGGPAHLGQDENGRHEFSLNFEVEIRNKNSYRE